MNFSVRFVDNMWGTRMTLRCALEVARMHSKNPIVVRITDDGVALTSAKDGGMDPVDGIHDVIVVDGEMSSIVLYEEDAEIRKNAMLEVASHVKDGGILVVANSAIYPYLGEIVDVLILVASEVEVSFFVSTIKICSGKE